MPFLGCVKKAHSYFFSVDLVHHIRIIVLIEFISTGFFSQNTSGSLFLPGLFTEMISFTLAIVNVTVWHEGRFCRQGTAVIFGVGYYLVILRINDGQAGLIQVRGGLKVYPSHRNAQSVAV